MKKILTIIIIALSVFLIYLGFKDKDIYYLSLGDSLANGMNTYGTNDYGYTDYVTDFLKKEEKLDNFVNLAKNNNRSIDIIKEIEENIKVNVDGKEKTLQNALIKADVVTISIGMNDLFSNITFNNDFGINDLYNKFDEVAADIEELFKLIREYCKEEVMYIGIYNYLGEEELNEFFDYANAKMKKIAESYNIKYIDIYEDFKNTIYFDSANAYFPNKQGYELISQKIIAVIKEEIIKNAWFLLILFAII